MKKTQKLRISFDSPDGGPALASMVAAVLAQHGADVSYDNERVAQAVMNVSDTGLRGLRVHLGTVTWVREEEAERWGKQK